VIALIRTLIAFVVFFLMLDGVGLAQGRRVALVIGVSRYQHAPPLANTANDANNVGTALRRLRFEVDLVIDPDRNAMESSIRNLGRKAEGAEASVFYYAGHAIEVGGQNLLVPAPANIESDRDLRFETIDLDSVLDGVAGRSTVSLLFLDSCRDNPFSKRLVATSRAISLRGLGPIDAATGTLIAFATAPGKTAEDGDAQNSPFTTALLHNIERPGIEVRRMLAEVRREVREATKGRQIPWENSALEGEFYFKPPPTTAQQPPARPEAKVAAMDPAELQQNLGKALQKVLPGITSAHVDAVLKRYGDGKENKAMAGSRERNTTWRFTNRESAYAAEQAVLEGCQIRHVNPCILVAVNATVASVPEDGTWVTRNMSRVGYDGQFNPQQIPVVRPDVRSRKDVADYLSVRGPKAIAIHPWGLLFIATGKVDQTSAEAEALKNCNEDPLRSGKDGPCFLYAIGNHVVLPLRITGPRSPAKTIAEAVRLIGPAKAEEAYRAARASKVLAIEPESGEWTYWDDAPSVEVAERMALGHCQVRTTKPCIVVARNDALIAADPFDAPLRDMEQARAEGRYDLAKLPFLARVSVDTARNYAQLPMPKAMALKTVPPRYVSATGTTVAEAERKALQECNQISGTPCMLYAVDDTIVLPRRMTAAAP
jgi:caspase domain-containing protein